MHNYLEVVLPPGDYRDDTDAVEDAAWRTPGVYDVHDKLVVTD